jgi:hypothetical protein
MDVNIHGIMISYNESLNFSKKIPSVREISCQCKLTESSYYICYFSYDERNNTLSKNIDIPSLNMSISSRYYPSVKSIEDIYQKYNMIRSDLKKYKLDNTSLGNIDTDSEIEYEPQKTLFIEDFFKLLMSLNRDKIINEIIQ